MGPLSKGQEGPDQTVDWTKRLWAELTNDLEDKSWNEIG